MNWCDTVPGLGIGLVNGLIFWLLDISDHDWNNIWLNRDGVKQKVDNSRYIYIYIKMEYAIVKIKV